MSPYCGWMDVRIRTLKETNKALKAEVSTKQLTIEGLQRECTRWEKQCLVTASDRDTLKEQLQSANERRILNYDSLMGWKKRAESAEERLEAEREGFLKREDALESRVESAESRLAKAQGILKQFPDSEGIFDEFSSEGMPVCKGLYYNWDKVEKWKKDFEKALGGGLS